MLKEAFPHSAVLDLPLVALLLFVAVFLAVVVMVWRQGATHSDYLHLSRLPLDDDTPDLLTPSNSDPDRGGDHGRR